MREINTSDIPHAWVMPSGLPSSDSAKILTGTFGIASAMLKSTSLPSNTEEARISGAVSPAARATASTVAVRIPPSALGKITVSTVRQRLTPSASAPSRKLPGTRSRTSWAPRATSGSMMIASATEPASRIARDVRRAGRRRRCR